MPDSIATLNSPLSDAQLTELNKALDKLQGNILKSHGRERAVHVFVRFTADTRSVKSWLRRFAKRVTSAAKQFRESEDFKKFGIPGTLLTSVVLTAKGYEHLRCDVSAFDDKFRAGMKDSVALLNDPAPTNWESGFQGEIHAMFLLADDAESFLLREARALMDEVEDIGVVVAVELGIGRRNESGDPIEHFGYVDGRSQPLFLQRDLDREPDGISVWNPAAGPDLVLVNDPLGGLDACGSYMVFRKLEQNVKGFKTAEQSLATALGLTGEDRERAGALAVGRFENGTPVVLQATAEAAMVAAAGRATVTLRSPTS